jgi:AcrR family transcriptional regulator
MAPRTRRTDNNAIASTACELLVEHGVSAITFAEVAKRCGLAAPTLVQRFGSRAGLLQATAAVLAAEVPVRFRRVGAGASRLTELQAALLAMAPLQGAAMRLAPFTSLDRYARELRVQISYALAAAVEAGELPPVDVARTARMLQIAFAGAVSQAALERSEMAGEIAVVITAQLADYV